MQTIVHTDLSFESGEETLVGNLTAPRGQNFPTIVFLAGTGAIDRYQRLVLPDGSIRPAKGPKGYLGQRMAELGVGFFAWDKRGVGASSGGSREPGEPPGDRDSHASVATDVADAKAALEFVASLPEVNEKTVTVMGHSAGVYFASLLADRTDLPVSYILWGGVHRNIDELMRFIYGQTRDYAERGPKELEFVKKHSSAIFAASFHTEEVLEAAARGDQTYEWTHEGIEYTQHLARLSQELESPLSEQFGRIDKPTMIIHGDKDLNVPVDDAYEIHKAMRSAGNTQSELVIVPGADHGMRVAPRTHTEEDRLIERVSFYKGHPVSEFFIYAVAGWALDQVLLIGRSSDE